jgi:hypothetical protein
MCSFLFRQLCNCRSEKGDNYLQGKAISWLNTFFKQFTPFSLTCLSGKDSFDFCLSDIVTKQAMHFLWIKGF